MILQILKNDLKKRKGINTILFVFITLATVFLSSSINNIMVVSSAVDYYLDYANVPDVNIMTRSDKNKKDIDSWLLQQKEKGTITAYEYNDLLSLTDKSIRMKKNGELSFFESNSVSMYLGEMNVDYSKVFDASGKPFVLKDGEIAISNEMMKRNSLNINDTIIIRLNNIEKTFKIKQRMKDATFGSEMVGMSRFMISHNDFQEYEKDANKMGLYYIDTDNVSEVNNKIIYMNYDSIVNVVTKDVYQRVFSFDMIMAALLILIGICLILIALLVLRFTLIFTMEEQYQEIGILKAVGLRDFAIKKLYLIKYLAIVTVGSCIGMVISLPISNMMINGVSNNMIMKDSESNLMIHILCAIFVIVLVLSFCYFCTRKMKKISAITAIRGGQSGERFQKCRGLRLYKRNFMRISMYLSLNDILGYMRRYAVLIITFCISFLLITIPLNTVNTMRSNEMARKFMSDPDCSIMVSKIEQASEEHFSDINSLQKGLTRLKKQLNEHGYDAEMAVVPIYFIKFSTFKHDDQKINILTTQLLGKDTQFLEYIQGSAPKLENEIAFSQGIMKQNNWSMGDYVHAVINGQDKTFIITGTYSDYIQLGKSARLNGRINCDKENMYDYWNIMLYLDTDKNQQQMAETMQAALPDYKWQITQDFIDHNVGGIQQSLNDALIPITAMLCAVIMLITLLMEKLLITREKGEIAMMKSMGFTYRTICSWQLQRMLFVAIVSLFISIPLSFLSNQFILKPIFAIMGADVAIQVDPVDVYLIYPGVLLIGIILATMVAARGVKRLHIREINNVE